MTSPSPATSHASTPPPVRPVGRAWIANGWRFGRSGLFILIGQFALFGLFAASCGTSPGHRGWIGLVPSDAAAVYVPTSDDRLSASPQAPYSTLFLGSIQQDLQILWEHADGRDLRYEAMILYTDRSMRLSAGWILAEDAGVQLLDHVALREEREVSLTGDRTVFVNHTYRFSGLEIRRLGGHAIRDHLYAAWVGRHLVLSPSPKLIERMILTHTGGVEAMRLPAGGAAEDLETGDLILNIARLDDWALVMIRMLNRPAVKGALDGGGIAILRADNVESGDGWLLRGSFATDSEGTGDLLNLLSGTDRPAVLDRYISQSAAAFARLQVPAEWTPRIDMAMDRPPMDGVSGSRPSSDGESVRLNDTDLFLLSRSQLLTMAEQSLGTELAVVAMAESGFNAGSERLHLRELLNPQPLRRLLDELVAEDLASVQGGTYMVQSRLLEERITLQKAPSVSWIHIDVLPDAVVVSPRQGLTESVRFDTERRFTLRYEADYAALFQNGGSSGSFALGLRTDLFSSFISPWLLPDASSLESWGENDRIAISGHRLSTSDPVSVTLRSLTTRASIQPYLDRWVYSLPGTTLSAPPITADIGGTNRPEVIFATEGGSVVALAGDGTSVLQLSTGSDVPVGSPVAYDWYGTRQNVIMVAAGRSIYGWDANGNRLPGFPVRLDEPIVSGLVVTDMTRDGLPDMMVATADRRVHLLNARGEPFPGWPQLVNTGLSDDPAVVMAGNRPLLVAVADNTLHVWQSNGEALPGFPLFEDTPFAATPVLADEHTLLAAVQAGEIVAISLQTPMKPFFETSESVIRADRTERVRIGEPGAMIGSPVFKEKVRMTAAVSAAEPGSPEADSTVSVVKDVMLAGTSQGTLQIVDRSGALVYAVSLGQRADPRHPPFIRDIDGDRRLELASTGIFGRLFAWDLSTGERREDLPSNAVAMPVFTDLDGDGRVELIAVTRDGLRCWTLDR